MTRSRTTFVAALALVLGACASPPPEEPPPPKPKLQPRAASYQEPQSFAGLIAAHSRWRREVDTPDLVWSDAAAAVAQAWADHLAAENQCKPMHSPGEDRLRTWGENIYSYWRGSDYEGFRRTPAEVVDSWGGESQWYRHQGNQCSAPEGKTCGHYTQVISTLSTHVGCGRARCPSAEVWVCNYAPPGNYQGTAPY